MQRYLSASALVCLPLLLASCFSTQKLPKRYKSVAIRNYPATKDSIKYFVSVSSYANDVSMHEKVKTQPAKNIFSLSGEGQKQLIESLADNEKTSDELLNKLSLDIIPASRQVSIKDNTHFTRKFTFGVDNLHLNPADRVVKVTIFLQPPVGAGHNIDIVSCNKIISSNKSATVMSGIAADGVSITEETKGNGDLSGTLTADVAFKYIGGTTTKEVYTVATLYNRDKTVAKPNDIVIAQQRVVSPNMERDIIVDYTYEAVVRHVTKGDNTLSEADDDVEIIKGKSTSSNIVVASYGHLSTKLWGITDGSHNLDVNGPTGQSTLLFPTYEDALNFITWFKHSSSDILANGRMSNNDYQVMLSAGGTLTDTFIKNCTVKGM